MDSAILTHDTVYKVWSNTSFTFWPLKMRQICCPEMSVTNQPTYAVQQLGTVKISVTPQPKPKILPTPAPLVARWCKYFEVLLYEYDKIKSAVKCH